MAIRIAQQTAPIITGEELAVLSDAGPCDLVAGSIVPVTPTSDVPPDLIVEILSPGNTWADTIQKLREFFSIGARLVDPSSQSVFAYRALTNVREFTVDNHLPGDDVLPGFSVAIREIFAG